MKTEEQAVPDYWVERYERDYGTNLRGLAAEQARSFFADPTKLNSCRGNLAESLRVFLLSVKFGKLGDYVYDRQAIGIWILSLPATAFPPLSARVAAIYGINEAVRRQRLGLDKQS